MPFFCEIQNADSVTPFRDMQSSVPGKEQEMTNVTPLKVQVLRHASPLRQTIAIVHAMPLMRLGLAGVLRTSPSISNIKFLTYGDLGQA